MLSLPQPSKMSVALGTANGRGFNQCAAKSYVRVRRTGRRELVRELAGAGLEPRECIEFCPSSSRHSCLKAKSRFDPFIRSNLRHRRHGHVFQNRYKSIVCEADSYFTELVRYIHLNPLRVGLVKDLKGLEKYPYCGHGAILGAVKNEWQDRDSVLAQFGSREGDAKGGYRRFVEEGVALGRRPELVGGGLVRSLGGWSEVKSQRRRGGPELSDERILGSGDFVERIMREAEARTQRQRAAKGRGRKVERLIADACKKHKVSLTELRSGSRRGKLSEVRAEVARKLVEDYGITLAEVARQVGVSTSAVSKSVRQTYSI